MDTLLEEINSYADLDGDICWEVLPETFDILSGGKWIQDHKCQYSENIVRHEETNRFFRIIRNRSGSGNSYWCYGDSNVSEVKRVEETIVVVKWVAV